MERAHRQGARLRHRFVFAVWPGRPERDGCAGREGAARRLQEGAGRSGASEGAAAARPGLLVQIEQGIRAMGRGDAAGRARNHRTGWIAREIGGDHEVSQDRSEEHTSELQSLAYLVCRLLLEKKKKYR